MAGSTDTGSTVAGSGTTFFGRPLGFFITGGVSVTTSIILFFGGLPLRLGGSGASASSPSTLVLYYLMNAGWMLNIGDDARGSL